MSTVNENSLFNNNEQEKTENKPAEATPTQGENPTTPETDGGQQEQQVTSQAFDQLLAGITSADGRQKYGSVEDALKALPHAQSHISQLEQDNKEFKSQIETMQEQLERMNKLEEMLANQSSQTNQNDNSGAGADETKIADMIRREMAQAAQQQSAQQNAQQVVKELTSMYGDQNAASKAFADKAAELEVDESFLSDMARRSPKAVLSYFNSSKPKTPQTPQGDVNTTGFQSKPEVPKGKLYGKTSDLIANWRASAESVNAKRNQ